MNYLSSMSFLSVSLAKYTATLLNDSQYMLSEQKNEELRSDNYIINSTVREWLQELLQQVACCFTKADLMWNSGIFFFFFPFWPPHSIWRSLGQGSDHCCSCDLSHCARPGDSNLPPSTPKTTRIPLQHGGNSRMVIFSGVLLSCLSWYHTSSKKKKSALFS